MAGVTRSGGIISPAAVQMMLSTLIRKQEKGFSCNQRQLGAIHSGGSPLTLFIREPLFQPTYPEDNRENPEIAPCAPGTGPVQSSRFSYNTQNIEIVYAPATPSPF